MVYLHWHFSGKIAGCLGFSIIRHEPGKNSLKPDSSRAIRTNSVTLDSERGSCSVFFNRGIISTQAIAHSLPKGKSGLPNAGALQTAIQDPTSSIRKRLVGDLEQGVLMLLDRAAKEEAIVITRLWFAKDIQ
jgi:hypothetical protein